MNPWRAFALTLAAAIVFAAAPARASRNPDQDALTLMVPLHQAVVGVKGASVAPTVRVRDSGGQTLVEVVAGTLVDGTWLAQLSAPSELTRRTLIQPGQTIEAVSGADSVTVEVPDMTAATDSETNTVSGRAPGMQALYLQLHRDPAIFGETQAPPGVAVLVAPDGNYSHKWPDLDLEPGVWGDIYATRDGHVFSTQFAPPQALVYWDQPIVQVRADPGQDLQVSSESPSGDRVFRSGAYPYAGSLYFVPLYDPEDLEAPPERLRAGDTFTLEREGAALFAEALPRITAGIDRPTRRALGTGARDARARIRLDPSGDAPAPFSDPVAVAPDGTWQLELTPGELAPDTRVEAILFGEGALAHHVTGGALGMRSDLYGFRAGGVLRGRDRVRLRLTGEGVLAQGQAETSFDGTFEVELFDGTGEPAVVRPGQNLVAEPDWGPAEEQIVPRLTARVVTDGSALEGDAPPGSVVNARVYTTPLSIFLALPYELPSVALQTVTDDAGRYRLDCRSPCAPEYGIVTADTGAHQVRLRWLARPVSEADVPAGTVRGLATAGDTVQVRAADRTWAGESRPSLGTDLPGWRADFGDRFAGGFEPGTSLELSVGTSVVSATVPAFAWTADTARDRVDGSGPAGMVVVVAAIPPEADATRAPAIRAALVPPSGRWTVEFPGFDLRGGDALELLIPYGDLLLRWYEPAVRGNDPPTATPVRQTWFSFVPVLHQP